MLLSDPTSRLGTLHVGTTPPVHCGQPRPVASDHLSRSPLTSPNSTFLIHWLLYFQVSCVTYAAPRPPSLPVLPSPSSGPVWTFVPSLTALPPVCSDVLPSNPPTLSRGLLTCLFSLHAGRMGLTSTATSLTKILSLTKLSLL